MWYDLHGAGKSGLDATFDIVAEYITSQFYRGNKEPFERHVPAFLSASVASDSPLRRKGERVIKADSFL